MSTTKQGLLINLAHQSEIYEQLRTYIPLHNWHPNHY